MLIINFLTPAIDFSRYEGLILTSKQGVEALKRYKSGWNHLPCICVSDATATYAKSAGFQQIEIASGYGESIVDVLGSHEHKGKWLYLRPKKIASGWVEDARKLGYTIEEAIVYETTCNPEVIVPRPEENAVLIFTSPSSVECFMNLHPFVLSQIVVAIGKTTQNALPDGVLSYVSEEQNIASAVELARKIAHEDEISSPF